MLPEHQNASVLSAEALLPGGSGNVGSLLANTGSAHLDPEQQKSGYSQAVGEFFYNCTFLFHLLFNGISYIHLHCVSCKITSALHLQA